ncbi:MAG: sodium ion-translocating decarboxylase subunit beta, partial [Candidatus Thorarchaeota archaeon]
ACLLLPIGTPLFAFFLAGNLLRESGVTDRLSKAASEEITNIFIICREVLKSTTWLSTLLIR